jgi:ribonuclease-3
MGILKLINSNETTHHSHNSYMGGNAFEALVGALYLDKGYDACMKFMEKRILGELINIDKVAYKEVNFKSKLIEWGQKNRVNIVFDLTEQSTDENGSPTFHIQILIEGVNGGSGTGFSKKEAQQTASKITLKWLKKDPVFIDNIFAAKSKRTKMEEEPYEVITEKILPESLLEQPSQESDDTIDTNVYATAATPAANTQPCHPRHSANEDIIAAAEEAAFAG